MSPALARNPLGTIERAYELARSGSCRKLTDVVATLKRERYDSVDAHLAGASIRQELRRLWEAAG
jgi:hypothetical protein